jgi:phosphate:Na+ symporter
MTILMLGSLLGGIGLFLLGMQMMTDGFKIAAGHALRTILERSTHTPLRGILSGAFITSLVQSSGAVTVATIGFVNAGLMNLTQAITIIYGSNIGTTMTGWLVTMIGFQFNVQAFALPLVGFGMLLRLIKSNSRHGAIGEAIAGFGLFFVGIDIMKSTFEGIGSGLQLSNLAGGDLYGHLIFLGIGFLLTFSMQSSSAAMAIALTATAGGLLPMDSAASVIIGANIGSTSTAALAVINATPNAKRVAAGHVIFNLVTGIAALILLPFLLELLLVLPRVLHRETNPTALLALFHTVFNVAGVCLMWPFTRFMVHRLQSMFRSHEENEASPLYLDRHIASTPLLAFHALAKEIGRMGDIARRMAKGAISSETGPGRQLAADQEILRKLELEVGGFINLVRRGDLPETFDHVLPNALRVTSYYREIAEVSLRVAHMQQQSRPLDNPELDQEISLYRQHVVKLLEMADVARKEYAADACSALFEKTEEMYRHLKSSLLKAGTKNLVPVAQMVSLIDLMSDVRRIADQIEKAGRYLSTLTEITPEKEKNGSEQTAT